MNYRKNKKRFRTALSQDLYTRTYPEAGLKTAYNHVGQVWAFKDRIAIDDYVVLPLKNRSAIAIGSVKSRYEFREDIGDAVRHVRRVKWIAKELPTS